MTEQLEESVCYCGSRGPEDGCLMPVYDCYNEGELCESE